MLWFLVHWLDQLKQTVRSQTSAADIDRESTNILLLLSSQRMSADSGPSVHAADWKPLIVFIVY